jgi:hypothetical protein
MTTCRVLDFVAVVLQLSRSHVFLVATPAERILDRRQLANIDTDQSRQ